MSSIRLIAALALGLGLGGCTQPAPPAPPPPPPGPAEPAYPAWIDSVPQEPNYVFAVGVGLRTLEGEAEQKRKAFINAVTALAQSARTQIDSRTVIHAEGGQSSYTETVVEDVDARTKALTEQAEEVQSFTDRRGVIGEFKGTIYVLVRIPRATLYGK